MLLHDLTIENFRSFKKYKLDKLARVNLLVGDNNCGKTSVLEAVRFLVSQEKIGTVLHSLELREDIKHEYSGTEIPDKSELRFGGSSLFTDGIHAQDYLDLKPIRIISSAPTTIQLLMQVTSPKDYQPAELLTVYSNGTADEEFESITMDGHGFLIRPWKKWKKSKMRSESSTFNCLFLAATHISTHQLAVLWKDVQEEKREVFAIEAMSVLDTKITGLKFSPLTETLRDVLIDYDGLLLVPMSVLGGGAPYLLRLGIGLASARPGTLLIDEIDTGLHYSRLADMWKMVITAARNLDVQVFATTHSLDCIRGLAEAVRNDELFVEEVAIFRIDRQTDQATRFAGEELEVIIENEIEVR